MPLDHTALQWHVILRGIFEGELVVEPGYLNGRAPG